MKTTLTLNDPAKAVAYFENKMAFTTGPIELERLLQSEKKLTVVDLRGDEDYRQGHIPGAINLPQDKWGEVDEHLLKDHLNVLYCYTTVCHLAATAALEFARKGYPVMEMDGGFQAWKDADLPLDITESKEPLHRFKEVATKLFHKEHA